MKKKKKKKKIKKKIIINKEQKKKQTKNIYIYFKIDQKFVSFRFTPHPKLTLNP